MKLRESISPTYDRRETGDRFFVSSSVGNKVVCNNKPIADPFVRHKITIGLFDALKSLLTTGRILVSVTVSGDRNIEEDVLELDANYIGHGSTRRAEFRSGIEQALGKI